MRIANLQGRAVAVTERGGVDLAEASAGRFGPEPSGVLADIDGVQQWWAGASPRLDTGLSTSALAADLSRLGPPVPRPPQVFAIGLNYLAHATETGMAPPQQPMVFTKFPSCIVGPAATVPLVDGMCDWEVELVVVIGRGGRRIGTAEAMGAVAGFCVGQDISERIRQREGTPPQFSLAKSSEGFGPTGPWITTPTSWTTPSTSRSDAPSTTRSCSGPAPPTWSSEWPSSWRTCQRSASFVRAT
ncbi:MAG: fumarylacetoacetate hydrolase family protein [Microthrixaceae bacterium]